MHKSLTYICFLFRMDVSDGVWRARCAAFRRRSGNAWALLLWWCGAVITVCILSTQSRRPSSGCSRTPSGTIITRTTRITCKTNREVLHQLNTLQTSWMLWMLTRWGEEMMLALDGCFQERFYDYYYYYFIYVLSQNNITCWMLGADIIFHTG